MEYKNLTIIGTSHIAKESVEEVKNTILKEKPDIIALELDKKRFYSLLHKKKKREKINLYNIFKIGVKGFFFALLGAWAEKKLGTIVGVSPGSEMLQAIKLAKKNRIKIALIDQDIEITLKKFSKAITWKEKLNFIVDIFKAVILKERKIEFDLTKVPDEKIIKKLIKEVKDRYPNVYRILVKQRNYIMAHNLFNLMQKKADKKILAIIGAGHEKEILDLIKKEGEGKITYTFRVGTAVV